MTPDASPLVVRRFRHRFVQVLVHREGFYSDWSRWYHCWRLGKLSYHVSSKGNRVISTSERKLSAYSGVSSLLVACSSRRVCISLACLFASDFWISCILRIWFRISSKCCCNSLVYRVWTSSPISRRCSMDYRSWTILSWSVDCKCNAVLSKCSSAPLVHASKACSLCIARASSF